MGLTDQWDFDDGHIDGEKKKKEKRKTNKSDTVAESCGVMVYKTFMGLYRVSYLKFPSQRLVSFTLWVL